MRTRTIAGALGVAAIVGGGFAAVPASAHPNLAVDVSASCEGGITYRVTGIDQGTSVSVKTTRTLNGQQVTQTMTWPYTLPSTNYPLVGFKGTVSATIESEGKADTVGGTFDCTTPPPTTTVPPPPVTPPPPPPPTCGELRVKYPKAGVKFWRIHGCTPPKPPTPPPPRRKREVCEAPATLRIIQQQTGTFYTETYPLRVTIRNTTGAATPKGALIITDSGLQNFVAPDGSRTERLVVPVGPMHKGQVRRVDRTMGFVGVEAFQAYFTTRARFVVEGVRCGRTSDTAFEG